MVRSMAVMMASSRSLAFPSPAAALPTASVMAASVRRMSQARISCLPEK
jgi:hypothetical protein